MTYKFNTILIKILRAFYTDTEKNNPKILMETQNTPNRAFFQRKKAGGIICSNFKIYYKAIVTKNMVLA